MPRSLPFTKSALSFAGSKATAADAGASATGTAPARALWPLLLGASDSGAGAAPKLVSFLASLRLTLTLLCSRPLRALPLATFAMLAAQSVMAFAKQEEEREGGEKKQREPCWKGRGKQGRRRGGGAITLTLTLTLTARLPCIDEATLPYSKLRVMSLHLP